MTMELEAARNTALQNIGRNVVAFQKMEAMLKFLIANQKIEGLPEQLQEELAKRTNEADRQTMGTLVNRFFNEVVPGSSEPAGNESAGDGAWSIEFELKLDDDEREEIQGALALIVRERNALIHQQLIRFDPNSTESCAALSKELEQQRDRLRPHYKYLQSAVGALIESQQELRDYFLSGDFLNPPG